MQTRGDQRHVPIRVRTTPAKRASSVLETLNHSSCLVKNCLIARMIGGSSVFSTSMSPSCSSFNFRLKNKGSNTSVAVTSSFCLAPNRRPRNKCGQEAAPPPPPPSAVNTATQALLVNGAVCDGGACGHTNSRAASRGWQSPASTRNLPAWKASQTLSSAREPGLRNGVNLSDAVTGKAPSRNAMMLRSAACWTGTTGSNKPSIRCFGISPRAIPCQKKTDIPMPNPAWLPCFCQSDFWCTCCKAGSSINAFALRGMRARKRIHARDLKAPDR
mmetsp:Transcript_112902/g.178393  ORF Transcript_112902/g.178393 Transcript_112902/m.178393 type:complete len:273 (-) Transcript_112902:108-926(-)